VWWEEVVGLGSRAGGGCGIGEQGGRRMRDWGAGRAEHGPDAGRARQGQQGRRDHGAPALPAIRHGSNAMCGLSCSAGLGKGLAMRHEACLLT